jgi:hypothetical protein
MKFVHLSTQPNINKIRKSGLHMGDGRRGRGVYAVPLMMLEREGSWSADDKSSDQSVPLTSSTLWKWLVKHDRSNGRAIAVVFELPSRFWPVNVRLEVSNKFAREFLTRISSSPPAECLISDDIFDYVYAELEQHEFTDFDCEVLTHKGLGHLLNLYKESGARPWVRNDQSIEIIIRSPIPSSCIGRIVPLYQRNIIFKKKKERGDKHRAKRYE